MCTFFRALLFKFRILLVSESELEFPQKSRSGPARAILKNFGPDRPEGVQLFAGPAPGPDLAPCKNGDKVVVFLTVVCFASSEGSWSAARVAPGSRQLDLFPSHSLKLK